MSVLRRMFTATAFVVAASGCASLDKDPNYDPILREKEEALVEKGCLSPNHVNGKWSLSLEQIFEDFLAANEGNSDLEGVGTIYDVGPEAIRQGGDCTQRPRYN